MTPTAVGRIPLMLNTWNMESVRKREEGGNDGIEGEGRREDRKGLLTTTHYRLTTYMFRQNPQEIIAVCVGVCPMQAFGGS